MDNDIVRVNLAALEESKYPLNRLGEDFIRSAREHTGSILSFEEKLNTLRELAEQNFFSFSRSELEEYLEEYRRMGYPPVSHSPRYRAAYAPAYRVVLKKYLP